VPIYAAISGTCCIWSVSQVLHTFTNPSVCLRREATALNAMSRGLTIPPAWEVPTAVRSLHVPAIHGCTIFMWKLVMGSINKPCSFCGHLRHHYAGAYTHILWRHGDLRAHGASYNMCADEIHSFLVRMIDQYTCNTMMNTVIAVRVSITRGSVGEEGAPNHAS
jgi:hypothetical protein